MPMTVMAIWTYCIWTFSLIHFRVSWWCIRLWFVYSAPPSSPSIL